MKHKRVLITNGKSLISLAVARSLSSHHLQVTIADDCLRSPVASSNAVACSLLTPSVDRPEEFISFLERNLAKGEYDVLLPVGTCDTLLVTQHIEQLAKYCHIPFASYDKIGFIHNKKNLIATCNNLNLPVPQTVVPNRVDDIDLLANNFHYPAVIKLQDTHSSKGLAYVKGPDNLIKTYKETVEKYNLHDKLPLIQEVILGTGFGVSCLYNNGKLRAFFTHKRIREISPSGGGSTCRESARHQKMEEVTFRLLDYLEWHGVAMVEFKLEDRTGTPFILEVNPRFWGSLSLAINAGVDFPWLLYQMAVEGDVAPVSEYRLGVRSRCLLTDIVSLIRHLKADQIDLSYLKDFLGFHSKESHIEDFSWRDPIPFLFFIKDNIFKSTW